MVAFVVVYGLDWVATVPPTIALCRDLFGSRGTIVFGWVFASHQMGAAAAALGAGVIRDVTGAYTIAWLGAAGLCAIAAIAVHQPAPSAAVRRRLRPQASGATGSSLRIPVWMANAFLIAAAMAPSIQRRPFWSQASFANQTRSTGRMTSS